MSETVIVIDFETTGLSVAQGARAIEVAAVKLDGDRITDMFQSLMNAGVPVPDKIVQITGISDAMVRKAPSSTDVMLRLNAFLGSDPLVAHNAKFDAGFLDSELHRVQIRRSNRFACTLLLARRLYPSAPNFKLSTVLGFVGVAMSVRMHRAQADATATAALWLQMKRDLEKKYGRGNPTFETMLHFGNHGRLNPIGPDVPQNSTVLCPGCGQRLRVPSGRLLLITCTSCRHKFEKRT
jgi:DNA polymerase-3 subunit epsilon